MDKQQQFDYHLIDLTLRWVFAEMSGHSMHASLILAARHIPDPHQQLWKQALQHYYEGNKPPVRGVLLWLQAETQSDGLQILMYHANRYWQQEITPFSVALEPALGELWSAYDPTTKPASMRIEDYMHWLRDLGTDTEAWSQFKTMGIHSLPFFECAIYYGAAHDDVAVFSFLKDMKDGQTQPLMDALKQGKD